MEKTPDYEGLCERIEAHMGRADPAEVLKDAHEAAQAIRTLLGEKARLLAADEALRDEYFEAMKSLAESGPKSCLATVQEAVRQMALARALTRGGTDE
jgi:hypothetical protein